LCPIKNYWTHSKWRFIAYFLCFLGLVSNRQIQKRRPFFMPKKPIEIDTLCAQKDMNNRNGKTRFCRAMTLLELVLAMVMITIVFAAVLPQFSAISHNWDIKQGSAEALQNGRVLMDHISRNLSRAKRITSVSASTVTSGYIQFVDYNDFNDRYDVAASDSYVEYGVVGSLSDLAGPVNSFKFTCYDANITLLSPVTDVNVIRLVKVDVTVDNSALKGQDKTFTTWVYLRTGANASPTISITQPTDGNSSFVAPASITISATASDSDGTVSKVDFYQGSTLLGTDTTGPSYSYTWGSVAAGSYSLTAKATDNDGAVTTSTAVNITVKSGSSLRAQYKAGETASSTQNMKPYVKVFNDGATTIALTDITIRYWFTSEPAGSDVFTCDYAGAGTGTITGTFGTSGGHRYLQIGFTSSANVPTYDGGTGVANTLPASANTDEVQTRINDSAWGWYTQTNDYSFDATKTSYADWTKVTVYYKGTLVWGTEP
jgi:type II secretory pathway pseudopilin PulG